MERADSFARFRSQRTPGLIIGDNVWIGARAIVLGGADIGEGSIVGAGAVVDFAVPPFTIVVGNPARAAGSARRT